jgi:hypothetical protein
MVAATFYYPSGTSSAVTKGAMTRVGSTLTYYVSDRTHAWWDPNATTIVYDGTDPVTTGYTLDYAGGYLHLSATPSGTVTVSFSYFVMERLGGGYGWSVSVKGGSAETTTFPVIGGETVDKTYIGTLTEWTATLKRHWYYARASVDMDVSVANTKLTWTWNGSGSFGNLEAVKYEEGAALQVARVGNLTTVTLETGVTTADAIKAHVAADPALASLWTVVDFSGHDGSGKVVAKTSTTCTGGRDSMEQIADMAKKVLCVFYLNAATATSERLEGVGVLTGIDTSDPIENIVEADLSFQGTGPLEYHAA